MKILVTGAAGFIGSATVLKLLEQGHEVVGVDNHNDYYAVGLKEDRLARHKYHPNYTHYVMDITNASYLNDIFTAHKFERVIHLAAQAGVRYSLIDPDAYVNSNLVGFATILQRCAAHCIPHLVYASSSSVYGGNIKVPFSTKDRTDQPLSLYAATKKANEVMAHSYSHIYNLPTTGLRFFTVYGPWDRPDMAMQKFTKAILTGEKIDVFNDGDLSRDFTYIDDIVEGVVKVMDHIPPSDWKEDSNSDAPSYLCNIGNGKPVPLLDMIEILGEALEEKVFQNPMSMQPGDVYQTHADTTELQQIIGYQPKVTIQEGIPKFVRWYKSYYS